MISALTAAAAGAAVKLFTKGVLLGIAIYTASRTSGSDGREARDYPQRK